MQIPLEIEVNPLELFQKERTSIGEVVQERRMVHAQQIALNQTVNIVHKHTKSMTTGWCPRNGWAKPWDCYQGEWTVGDKTYPWNECAQNKQGIYWCSVCAKHKSYGWCS